MLSDFDVALTDDEEATEDAIFRLLSDRIAGMIEGNMEYLMSLLYRNDVDEAKIHAALSPASPAPANEALALLVLERQKQRIATKKRYGRQAIDDLEDEWKF